MTCTTPFPPAGFLKELRIFCCVSVWRPPVTTHSSFLMRRSHSVSLWMYFSRCCSLWWCRECSHSQRVNTCSFHQGLYDLTRHLWTTPSGEVQQQCEVTSIASTLPNNRQPTLLLTRYRPLSFLFLKTPTPVFSFFWSASFLSHLTVELRPRPPPPRIAVALDVTLAARDCASFSFSAEGNPKPANRDSSTMELRRGFSSRLGFSTQEGGGWGVLSVWVCTP